jgi:hypothetical protein
LNPSILKTERPPVTCARSDSYGGRRNTPDRPASALPRERVRSWHIAKFFCNAKLGRYRGVADFEQASPRSIWLKLPTRFSGFRGELEELIGDQGAVWRRAWRLFTAIRVFQRHCRREGRRMGLPLQSRRRARCRAGPWAFCKLRDDELVPLICPTCQMFSRDRSKHPCQRPPCYFAWGCFRYFSWERAPRRPCRCRSVRNPKAPCFAMASSGFQPQTGIILLKVTVARQKQRLRVAESGWIAAGRKT